jgi:hypothetical protein
MGPVTRGRPSLGHGIHQTLILLSLILPFLAGSRVDAQADLQRMPTDLQRMPTTEREELLARFEEASNKLTQLAESNHVWALEEVCGLLDPSQMVGSL